MRNAVLVSTTLALAIACTPARYPASEHNVDHGETVDAWFENDDAGTIVYGRDSGEQPEDAWVPPGEDAWVAPSHDASVHVSTDAWVAPHPDAWTMPSCPSYTSDVKPIYVRHCASCHTTGSDPRFGSSYSVATQSSSSCGTSMAECTIQLGMPGGSMARRDSLGGFSTSEISTIQSWISCGTPM